MGEINRDHCTAARATNPFQANVNIFWASMRIRDFIAVVAVLIVASPSCFVLANSMIAGTGTNGADANRCCHNPISCDYMGGATTLDKAQCCPNGGEVTVIHDLNSDVLTCDCGVAQGDCRTDGVTLQPYGHHSTLPLNSQYNIRDSR